MHDVGLSDMETLARSYTKLCLENVQTIKITTENNYI